MQNIQNKIIGTLESVKDKLEEDESVAKRDKYFARTEDEKADAVVEALPQTDIDKFKLLGLELLDIGLFYGYKGVEKVKSLPLY